MRRGREPTALSTRKQKINRHPKRKKKRDERSEEPMHALGPINAASISSPSRISTVIPSAVEGPCVFPIGFASRPIFLLGCELPLMINSVLSPSSPVIQKPLHTLHIHIRKIRRRPPRLNHPHRVLQVPPHRSQQSQRHHRRPMHPRRAMDKQFRPRL